MDCAPWKRFSCDESARTDSPPKKLSDEIDLEFLYLSSVAELTAAGCAAAGGGENVRC